MEYTLYPLDQRIATDNEGTSAAPIVVDSHNDVME